MSDPAERSLKDEYESLVGKAKQLGLELEASRLTNSYNSIKYHASNPDEEARRETIERFTKIAKELKEKIKEEGG
ncbi:MAG: hypothetical protein M3258_09425 [Thermoproteota archaeon]|nr:hypothetical protein [Thermoproteota archaeon]